MGSEIGVFMVFIVYYTERLVTQCGSEIDDSINMQLMINKLKIKHFIVILNYHSLATSIRK